MSRTWSKIKNRDHICKRKNTSSVCFFFIKKKQTDENECEYILFRIDVYFTEYFLAVEIDEKSHTNRGLIFEEKRQKALEKNLTVNLLELILVGKIMLQSIKLVEYRRLSVSLKTKNNKIK